MSRSRSAFFGFLVLRNSLLAEDDKMTSKLRSSIASSSILENGSSGSCIVTAGDWGGTARVAACKSRSFVAVRLFAIKGRVFLMITGGVEFEGTLFATGSVALILML
jgi:hypothetical protein